MCRNSFPSPHAPRITVSDLFGKVIKTKSRTRGRVRRGGSGDRGFTRCSGPTASFPERGRLGLAGAGISKQGVKETRLDPREQPGGRTVPLRLSSHACRRHWRCLCPLSLSLPHTHIHTHVQLYPYTLSFLSLFSSRPSDVPPRLTLLLPEHLLSTPLKAGLLGTILCPDVRRCLSFPLSFEDHFLLGMEFQIVRYFLLALYNTARVFS